MEKIRVLFVCKDNSIRSQIAAAFLNKYFGERFQAFSAGIEPKEINPHVLKALSEIGIDISQNKAKALEEFRNEYFDYIITLCDYARNSSNQFPRHKKQLHKNFKNYCISSLCDRVKEFELCFPEHKKHFIKGRCSFSGEKESDEALISSLRLLREEIFEWVEKEAVF